MSIVEISENLEDIDYKKFDGITLQKAADYQQRAKVLLDAATAIKSHYQKIYDHLRLTRVPESMDAEDVNTVTFKEIGRVTLTSDIFASIIKDKKDEAWDWLRDNNHGGIIRETINAGTLKAALKAMIQKGEMPPKDLFKITPFSRASITKVK